MNTILFAYTIYTIGVVLAALMAYDGSTRQEVLRSDNTRWVYYVAMYTTPFVIMALPLDVMDRIEQRKKTKADKKETEWKENIAINSYLDDALYGDDPLR